jgi:hypothetical protein
MSEKFKPNINLPKLQAFLKEKWGDNRKCPYCDGTEWNVTSTCGSLDELLPNNQRGKFMPLVPIICVKCGNTVLIHPAASDSMDNSDEEEATHVKRN